MSQCEMGSATEGRCQEKATRYAGYKGANEWAGKVCEMHASLLDWSERLVKE